MSKALIVSTVLLVVASAATAGPPAPSQSALEASTIIVIPNVRVPSEGLVTGGQPTRAALLEAAEHGYTTIIDLRGEGEDRGFDEAEEVERLGMRYVAIPISGAEDLTEENARRLDDALAEAEGEGQVMVHCASGNRVGALFALRAYHVEEVTPEHALEIGLEAGLTGLEQTVRERLDQPTATSEEPRPED